MSTATAISKPPVIIAPKQPRLITKEEFLRKYSNKEDGYKYEWNNGVVEKTKAMNQQQSKFFFRLLQVFLKTSAAQQGSMLINETDMDTSPVRLRRPDISFYNYHQLPQMWSGENEISPWITEIISPNDKAEDVNAKMKEYFQAGVQVVWHIYPSSKQVYVYRSPEDVTICEGKTLCSAAPVMPDLFISAETLFA